MKCQDSGLFSGDSLILVGRVGAPHGLKGEVKVKSFTEFLTTYEKFSELLVKFPESSEFKIVEIVQVRFFDKKLLILFKNVDDRDSARLLVGSCLYVRKNGLFPLEDSTFFWSDLIGICVKSTDGRVIGILESIIQTGANDVYVVKAGRIGEETEVLLPAIRSVILRVDLSKNLMVVNLPKY